MKQCRECGKPFEAKHGWEKTCFQCWAKSTKSKFTERESECQVCGVAYTQKFKTATTCPKCYFANKRENELADAEAAAYRNGYALGFEEGRASASVSPQVSGENFTPDMLKKMLRLCHPDMHDEARGDLCHEVTTVLTRMLANSKR